MKRAVFLKNTVILTLTSLFLRTVGMFFRVYISNKIGSEGMGLYQMIFSVYILASTVAASGISIAVTRLVSEAGEHVSKTAASSILKRAFFLSLIMGLAAFLALYAGAGWVSLHWIKDERAILAIRVLSFSLPFMSVSSCLHGYFIARRRIGVTSAAQIFEQFIRVAIVLIFIDRFVAYGAGYGCVAVMLGNTLADMAACLYVFIGYRLDMKKNLKPSSQSAARRPILSRLIAIAAPIAAAGWLTTLLRTVENLLVPNCLSRFTQSREKALSEFGSLKGMAMPILFFPSSFLSALSILLIPEISEAKANKQTARIDRTIMIALRISTTIAILAGGLFTVFSEDLGMLLYKSREVGFYIRILGPIMPLIYLEHIVDGILKGLNQQVSSLRYNVIDSASRIGLIFVLVPRYGMKGFLFVMLFSNVLTSFLNLRRLLIVTEMRLDWSRIAVRPLLSLTAAILCMTCTVGRLMKGGLLTPLTYVLSGGLFISAVYICLLFLTGCVKIGDFAGWLGRRA